MTVKRSTLYSNWKQKKKTKKPTEIKVKYLKKTLGIKGKKGQRDRLQLKRAH